MREQTSSRDGAIRLIINRCIERPAEQTQSSCVFGLDDHKSPSLVSLKDFRFGGFTQIQGAETQVGFTPDVSPMFTRDIGTQEIYALSVKWP